MIHPEIVGFEAGGRFTIPNLGGSGGGLLPAGRRGSERNDEYL
jgi:hypothetical protein